MIMSKKILIVAPHADDEALGVGGSVFKHLQNDNEVHLIICGIRSNDVVEQINNATKHYTSVRHLVYQDELYYSVFDMLLRSVECFYNLVQPDVVYIPNHDDFNRDHRCVHEICEIVCRRFQTNPPDQILMYETPSSTTQSFNNNFKCNYYEKLDFEHVDAKIKTMEKYVNEMREYPNPRSMKGLLTYAQFRGMECGEEYAEGFQLVYKKS